MEALECLCAEFLLRSENVHTCGDWSTLVVTDSREFLAMEPSNVQMQNFCICAQGSISSPAQLSEGLLFNLNGELLQARTRDFRGVPQSLNYAVVHAELLQVDTRDFRGGPKPLSYAVARPLSVAISSRSICEEEPCNLIRRTSATQARF